MSRMVTIRRAAPEDASFLSDLALRSKAHWGYPQAFIEACRDELRIAPEQLRDTDYQCFLAAEQRQTLGYYAVMRVLEKVYELDALFVEPRFIGRGIGRILVDHAVERVAKSGGRQLTVQGDPHASGFYLAVGAQEVGTRESGSIPGRFLPVFEIDVCAYEASSTDSARRDHATQNE